MDIATGTMRLRCGFDQDILQDHGRRYWDWLHNIVIMAGMKKELVSKVLFGVEV